MLSSALGGILRAGAVVLTAGALGGGVYFLVQAGESQDPSQEDSTRLQAPSGPTVTLEAPRDLSPPGDLSGPVEVKAPPTPTFPPAPIADPGIDTSDWKTYVSRYGFSFRYPPDWRVDEEGRVRLLNPIGAAALDAARARDDPHVDQIQGMADFGVSTYEATTSGFDIDVHIAACETPDPLGAEDDPPGQARAVTFAGRTAVECRGIGVDRSGVRSVGLSYWIHFPPGHITLIGGYVVSEDPADLSVLKAFIASLSFEGAR